MTQRPGGPDTRGTPAMKRDHELHGRRRSRNIGVFLVLAAFVGLLYWVTIVKMVNLGNPWG